MQSLECDDAVDEGRSKRPAKRQRVARACVPCRYAKLRCDGQQPICSTCKQLEKRCTYASVAKRRGLRSGYVRALELLWGLTLHEIENVDSVVDQLLSRLSKQDLIASADRTDSHSTASAVLDRWKQSDISQHLEELLNENEGPTNEAGVRGVDYRSQDLKTSMSPSWVVIEKKEAEHTGPNTSIPNVSLQSDDSNPALVPAIAVKDDHTSPSRPPPYASQLLQLFFNHTQSWLPIVERHVLLRTSFQCQRNPSLAHHGDQAALHGVYAYVSTSLSHLLTDKEASQHAKQHSNAFYAQAYSMLPIDSDQPVEIGHAQCALLLSLSRLGSRVFKSSWRLAKVAIHLMQEIAHQHRNNNDEEVLARVWLGCFVIDTISSSYLEYKPSMNFNDVVKWCQINENGVEEWQPWQPFGLSGDHGSHRTTVLEIPTHSASLLILQVKLLRILNNSLHHQSACGIMTMNDLEVWQQELTNCLHRVGLDSSFRNGEIDMLKLPPSFLSLSIMYTSVFERITRQDQGPSLVTNRPTQGTSYPHLSDTALQKLKRECSSFRQLPALQLFPPEQRLPSLDVSLSEHRNQQQHQKEIECLSSVGSLYTEAEIVPSNMAGFHSIMGSQEQSQTDFTPSNTNTHVNETTPIEQVPDSGTQSLDSYLYSVDAPFLEFLDTLDDRSVHDSDLFSKSLGYKF
ncbi:hypothetical protein F5884DRAFT_406772 [Xylogone sp. PMI_703]|nr:hypothetical protein F5884DRAFT_406772 [Xylogone sp. PMI_703]